MNIVRRRFLTPKLRNVKAVGFVSDFEGEVMLGIGTRRRRKVLRLTDLARGR